MSQGRPLPPGLKPVLRKDGTQMTDEGGRLKWRGRHQPRMPGNPVKRLDFTKTFYGSRSVVERQFMRWLNDIMQKLESGEYEDVVKQRAKKETVEEYLERWIAAKKAAGRPSTWKAKHGILKARVYPVIGGILLRELETSHVQEVLTKTLSQCSPRYAYDVRQLLSQAFNDALKEHPRPFPVSPVDGTPKIKKTPDTPEQYRQRALTPDEMKAFVKAIEADWYREALLALLYLGMRPSEMAALRWQDFDEEKKELRIVDAASRRDISKLRLPRDQTSTAVKSAHSKRTLLLPKGAVVIFKAQRKKQERRKAEIAAAKMQRQWESLDLIFTAPFGGPIHERSISTRHLHPACDRAGIRRISLYDLRHTFIVNMLDKGANVARLAKFVGHTPDTLLRFYSRVDDRDETMANMIDGAFKSLFED